MIRIYQKKLLKKGETISLDEAAAHHLIHVLRLKVGQEIRVFNGEGGEFHGKIQTINKKSCEILLEQYEEIDHESPLKIQLAIGISRGQKMDYAIQKAVELGVSEIIPILTEHCSIPHSKSFLENKWSHWHGIIISACEQSNRNRLPALWKPMTLTEFFVQCEASLQLVCVLNGGSRLNSFPKPDSDICLLVGPEGGLSQSEIAEATQNQFQLLSFGPRVLRTETAPMVAIAVCQSLWGDF